MVTTNSALETGTHRSLPNSRRVYIKGSRVRVPMREIEQHSTRLLSGNIEPNKPVKVYDCSGPWGDPDFAGSVEEGLPALRQEWILGRNDVEEYDGRIVRPEDNGFLSDRHVTGSGERQFTAGRRPLHSKGSPVTQLWYARQGEVTPEMEFVALRENQGLESLIE